MDGIDAMTKGRLMSGYPLDIDENVRLPAKTVGDILFIGEQEYSKMISLLAIDKTMLVEDVEKQEALGDIGSFDIIVKNCYYSVETRNQIVSYLSYFFEEEVNFIEDMLCFYIGDFDDNKMLNADNYEKFLECMKIQNKIDNDKAKKKPKKQSKKAEMLAKQRAKGRNLLAKARGQNEVKLADLLLNLSTFLNGDFDACNKLTQYQFYELYQKMLRKEKYSQSFSVYVAGGDPKSLDLDTHWTAKEVEKKQERPQSI